WRDGKVQAVLSNWVVIYPQFLTPSPRVLLSVDFRRAMLHAIDRQEMAGTLMAGQVPVAHSPLAPGSRQFQVTDPLVMKYEYDQRKAAALLESLGYARGPDGLLRDGQGDPLALELRATGHREIAVKSTWPVSDYWGRQGVSVSPYIIPIQQVSDIETQAT